MIRFGMRFIDEPKGNSIVCKLRPSYIDGDFARLIRVLHALGLNENEDYIKDIFDVEFTGVARLQEGDKNNVEKGKKIAKFKAYRAFYNEYARRRRAAEKAIFDDLFKVQSSTDTMEEHAAYLTKMIKDIAYDRFD